MRKCYLLILLVLSIVLAGCGSSPAPTPKLTIEVAGSGQGTVTSIPEGIDCGTTCTLTSDQEIVLTATPAAGSAFSKWDGCDNATANTCTVTLNTDKTITASFDKSVVGGYTGKIIFYSPDTPIGNGLLASMKLEATNTGYAGKVTPLADIGLPAITIICGDIASNDTLSCKLTIPDSPETIEIKAELTGTTKFSGTSSSDKVTLNGIPTDRIDFEFTTDAYQPEKTEINPNDPKPMVEGTYKGPLEIEIEIPNSFAVFPSELKITLKDGKPVATLAIVAPLIEDSPDNPVSNQEKGTCGELDSKNILICEVDVQGGIFKFTGEVTSTSYSGKFEGIPPADFSGPIINGSYNFTRK